MIIIQYTKEIKYKAHYKDSNGFLIKFGPYPTLKQMKVSIKEYMDSIQKDYKIKKE